MNPLVPNHTFIIAEAGVNHNGSLALAKQLVEVAANAKADAIKFQTFRANKLVSKSAPKADYQIKATNQSESQLEMIQQLELSKADHLALIDHCKQFNILFLSSAFDEDSIDLLEDIGMPIYKIPSGEITNLTMLKKIAKLHKPVILSTGMSTMEEITLAVDALQANGTDQLTLLHCNTEYPTPMEDVNLRAMDLLQETFELPVGYSDHTLGIEVPIAAVALGAVVIEKHITLDKTMDGPDHKASIDPQELVAMVQSIRNIELALGKKRKEVSPSEEKNRNIARKSLVATRAIQIGEPFTKENLSLKRPGTGISGIHFESMIGKIAKHSYAQDQLIQMDEVE